MDDPFVSVILPVYNASDFLLDSIKSILSQTYQFFELIIIDDGSVDNSLEIIQTFKDKRIKLLRNITNEGLIKVLNKGIDISSGEYILRMDADDISVPDRLEKQVSFMIKNSDVVVCGTWFEIFGKKNEIIKYPVSHEEIYLNFLLTCPIGHPTTIIRADILRKNKLYFDTAFKHSEDTNLWVRISKYGRLANIPEVLLKYRMHEEQITNKHAVEVNNSFNKTRNILFSNICAHLNESTSISPFSETDISFSHIVFMEKKILCLINKNKLTGKFNESLFGKCLGRLWLEIVNNAKYISFKNLVHILISPVISYSQMVGYYRLILFKKWMRSHLSIL
jgi:glycosyltransferase involved in cell wall biosynthesis